MRGLGAKNNRTVNGKPERLCSRCDLWFPATLKYFHAKKGKLRSACKKCNRTSQRELMRLRYQPKSAVKMLDRLWQPPKGERHGTDRMDEADRREDGPVA